MRRFIIRVAFFFLLVVLSNLGYLIALQKTDFNFMKRIEALNLEAPDHDLLVIGNSLALDGIDTEELSENGYNSYNLALGGAGLATCLLQLEEYMSLYQHKPKYVVLGVSSFLGSFDAGGIHPIVDYTRIDQQGSYLDIPMVKFRWLFTEMLKKMVSKEHRNAYLKKGQLRFSRQVADNSNINENNVFPKEKYQSADLIKKIIKTCTDNDIKLVVVELPGFKKCRHQKSFDCFTLDDMGENGILLDYNHFGMDEVLDSRTDWIGNSHLNSYGAKKITKMLVQDLRRIDVSTDHCYRDLLSDKQLESKPSNALVLNK